MRSLGHQLRVGEEGQLGEGDAGRDLHHHHVHNQLRVGSNCKERKRISVVRACVRVRACVLPGTARSNTKWVVALSRRSRSNTLTRSQTAHNTHQTASPDSESFAKKEGR